MSNEENAIVKATDTIAPIVVPPLSVDEVVEHFNKIQELKRKLITETDMVKIGDKPYILKSGWRKLAFAFNLRDEIMREEKEDRPDGEVIYRIWTKVTAPNGRYVVAVGCASSKERKFTHEAHDPYALAHTRSKNRAISDIIGLGEVSAEEMLGEDRQEVKVVTVPFESSKWVDKSPTPTISAPESAGTPPDAMPLRSAGKVWGHFKKTEHGGELYFKPPLDMSNDQVRHLVEAFLCNKVLDEIARKVEMQSESTGSQYMFHYELITEGNELQGISFAADPEVLTDDKISDIRGAAAWTAARASEKKNTERTKA